MKIRCRISQHLLSSCLSKQDHGRGASFLERPSQSLLTNFEVHQYWLGLSFLSNGCVFKIYALALASGDFFAWLLFFFYISYFVKHYFILIFFLDCFFLFCAINSVISVERGPSFIKLASVYKTDVKMKSKIN